MGPTLGANFCHGFLPSPSLGGDLSTGPTALWIDNSEMAGVVEVVLFTQEQIWRGLQIKTQREKKEGREGKETLRKGLYNKQEQSQICINNGCKSNMPLY